MKKIFLRIDDIGASTKRYEIYSKFGFGIGNILFLKYIKPFKAWGPYRELKADDWKKVFDILSSLNAKLTVGVTATWVEKDGTLVPFPDKYPAQSELLKNADQQGLIEIANHGLTHCVVGKHLPKLFSGNRKYHREFWDWQPKKIHDDHIAKSQLIFKDWLGKSPTTLIPPGNVYSKDTLKASEKNGIKVINSYMNFNIKSNVKIVNDDSIDPFHDKELVEDGLDFLRNKIKSYRGEAEFNLIKDFE